MPAANPNSNSRPAWARYSVALGSVAIGWLAREALTRAVGPTALPFIFFFPAVALAAWYGSLGPGLLAALLSAWAASWSYIEPAHSFRIHSVGDLVALGAFLLSSLLIIGALEAMHRAKRHLIDEIGERTNAQTALAQEQQLLAVTLTSIGDGVITTDAQGQVSDVSQERNGFVARQPVAPSR